MRVGVILPPPEPGEDRPVDIPAAARHAEAVGLDSVWHGDHLATGEPSVECTVALAAASAATTTVALGTSVLVPAMRPLAWAAKQVASLQYVAGGRLILGVGSGGGEAQWDAAGVPYAERGPRTDGALARLPALVAGESVRLDDVPGAPEVELAPGVTMPPVWVGNASTVAIRRAARSGDGWFPSLVTPAALAAGVERVSGLAAEHGRDRPTVAVGAVGAVGTGPGRPSREELAAYIAEAYGGTEQELASVPIVGEADEVAERLEAYRAAGADHVVLFLIGDDWRGQVETLAEARSALVG